MGQQHTATLERLASADEGGGEHHPADVMETFAGATLISNYAMVAQRHMFEYGTTSEQLAEISTATRLPRDA
jgi:acetyl-CoA C-acetyltransferase